jgi:hypothetical protein
MVSGVDSLGGVTNSGFDVDVDDCPGKGVAVGVGPACGRRSPRTTPRIPLDCNANEEMIIRSMNGFGRNNGRDE